MKYSDSELLNRVKSLPRYRGMPKNLIIAVRSKTDTPNVFDDKMYVYINEKFVMVTSCTTNPGAPILTGGWKKYNKKGAAVLKADEIYYDTYRRSNGTTIRHHNGKMPCLRQVKPMAYYRDGNNDTKTDTVGNIEIANNSTNIHFNSYNIWNKIKTTIVGVWSAGCQVLNDSNDYNRLINLFGDEPVSYALLNEF